MASMILKSISPNTTKLGFIGVGVMGQSMAAHLMKHGYAMTVYSRTASKCAALVEAGAKLARSPKEVAEQSDIIFSIVGYPKDVESVMLGSSETGARDAVIDGVRPGSIVVDMTTSKPSIAKRLHELFKEKSVFSMDCPVSGGDIGARNAALTIMCGGDQEVFDALVPVLQCMGKTVRLMGGPGMGQATKCANQTMIASTMVGVCEALLFAHKSGLNVEDVIAVLSGGAAQCFSLTSYGPRILKGDMKPGFYVEHFVKDMKIVLEECDRMGIVLPGLTQAKMLYEILIAQGGGRLGTQALMLALEKLNNIEFVPKNL
ncbi:mitochondrial 3-hydroxyisobutyrate dehydrogenase [Andalucia godoyi]|uniref:Mitochondrial 3-hydroxyisobutyrate dehydrogenase n=1 Tax=Andalucia godoyi TaxID=505711 RepID=A0A8K0AIM9_ANDGO|nr:mitochondrial 3-hydroxyisobutyrate dehydrogenase [Andalucia godoyi]|eukprot:ANDGO_06544.mRNA.1 mitochondrial 3-hydroxyisobutyrate dehydrogenase